jgi:hypothetical protein
MMEVYGPSKDGGKYGGFDTILHRNQHGHCSTLHKHPCEKMQVIPNSLWSRIESYPGSQYDIKISYKDAVSLSVWPTG